ncbi:hypothetical protein CLIB1423_02S11364 [[Candida] railenensis]|uniref:Peptidyl-tRNA hydrolase n=1 Tax=[Candida] railenensis TaxID=45579 RepID=A0A9P0VX32_9ASCO|nr:hypothetical protein CLIB1423_02S11364 [[Candida] railenensis]
MDVRRIIIFAVSNPLPMNRHSAGKYILLKLAKAFDVDLNHHQSSKSYTAATYENFTLVKSQVYMNESGKALQSFLRDQRPSPEDSLVILYDDFELKTGKIRLSPMKSPESHNGLSSCQSVLNKMDSNLLKTSIFKLGIGIGPKPKDSNKLTMSSWVLSKFKPNEIEDLDDMSLRLVADYLDFISDENIQSVTDQTARVNKIFAKKIQRGEYT